MRRPWCALALLFAAGCHDDPTSAPIPFGTYTAVSVNGQPYPLQTRTTPTPEFTLSAQLTLRPDSLYIRTAVVAATPAGAAERVVADSGHLEVANTGQHVLCPFRAAWCGLATIQGRRLTIDWQFYDTHTADVYER